MLELLSILRRSPAETLVKVKNPNQKRNEFLKTVLKVLLLGGVGTAILILPWIGFNGWRGFCRVVLFNCFVWLILWIGNGLISNFNSSRFSWVHQPVKTLLIVSSSVFLYTVLSMTVFLCSWEFFANGRPISETLNGLSFESFYTFLIITFFVSLFMHGRSFLMQWRTSLLEAEKFKREMISSQFETLKNQVNPHFLFNSLNVLSTLVYKDQDVAAHFIKQLSDVYRYVLDVKDKEVVPISEELKALESYVYLCKIRYGTNLNVHINVEDDHSHIPPLTLQMLVENAIKHNIVSNARPLTINIERDEHGYILVENNLQKKSSLEAGTGLGLPNIKERYRFLAGKKVIVSETGDFFRVQVPILKLS
ncbi:MAG: histidine kinase [Bacteroidota bacterium]